MNGSNKPQMQTRATAQASTQAMTRSPWRWLRATSFVAIMAFGALQAYAAATDRPGREQRGYCDDVLPCMAACGEAGGTYYGLLPNGGPLCDCCAPD